MKKIIATILAACTLLLSAQLTLAEYINESGTATDGQAEDSSVTILLNSEELVLDVDAYIKNDRTMVPLRGVFEACGANVNWDGETRTVLITKTDGEETTFIFLQADSDTAFINSEKKTLDAPAEIVGDRTMVPLRFIMEELGAAVSWDDEARTVSIVTE